MIRLTDMHIVESKDDLMAIPDGKLLINTINAHSFNTALNDKLFAEALLNGDYLIPDGASIVKACKFLKAVSRPKERIAGWDLFEMEMQRLNERSSERKHLRVMFMGASDHVLSKIKERASHDYPNLDIFTYSPPYKPVFSEADNNEMVNAINNCEPDLLWIGLTAPKQEKWAYQHWDVLKINCHVGTIGAVFDFYAGSAKRAPKWFQDNSMEWFYRLVKEPKRLWRRYILGNPLFVWNIIKEKCQDHSNHSGL